jgi:hypothetical protein
VTDLQTLYKGKAIEGNVSVAQIAIWNKGKQSIKPANILSPIQVYTVGKSPILEATIRKVSRDEVHFQLDENIFFLGVQPISWKILEHYDAAIIQIVYNGDENEHFSVCGTIEGQRKITNSNWIPHREFPRLELKLLIICIVLLFGIFFVASALSKRKEWLQLHPKVKQLIDMDSRSNPILPLLAFGSFIGIILTTLVLISYLFYILGDKLPIDF